MKTSIFCAFVGGAAFLTALIAFYKQDISSGAIMLALAIVNVGNAFMQAPRKS